MRINEARIKLDRSRKKLYGLGKFLLPLSDHPQRRKSLWLGRRVEQTQPRFLLSAAQVVLIYEVDRLLDMIRNRLRPRQRRSGNQKIEDQRSGADSHGSLW